MTFGVATLGGASIIICDYLEDILISAIVRNLFDGGDEKSRKIECELNQLKTLQSINEIEYEEIIKKNLFILFREKLRLFLMDTYESYINSYKISVALDIACKYERLNMVEFIIQTTKVESSSGASFLLEYDSEFIGKALNDHFSEFLKLKVKCILILYPRTYKNLHKYVEMIKFDANFTNEELSNHWVWDLNLNHIQELTNKLNAICRERKLPLKFFTYSQFESPDCLYHGFDDEYENKIVELIDMNHEKANEMAALYQMMALTKHNERYFDKEDIKPYMIETAIELFRSEFVQEHIIANINDIF